MCVCARAHYISCVFTLILSNSNSNSSEMKTCLGLITTRRCEWVHVNVNVHAWSPMHSIYSTYSSWNYEAMMIIHACVYVFDML